MKRAHPRDAAIQRYRNGTLDELEARKVNKHLAECAACRQAAADYEAMEASLFALPLEEPSAGFTDKVMEEIRMLQVEDIHRTAGRESSRNKEQVRFRLRRPELMNAIVASAATYFLISSGIVGKFFAIDPGSMEVRLLTKTVEVMGWIGRMSQVFQS